MQRSRGTGPRATVSGTSRFIVGRGPVPRHDRSQQRHREGQALALQARTKKNARGTGPRATKPKTIAGDRPPRYGIQNRPLTVGRGTGPRHAAVYRKIAGDRPTRYGIQNGSSYRRARACPSPCCGLPENRGGQAPALRYSVVCDRLIANGRATLNTPLSYRRAMGKPVPRHANRLNQDFQDFRICRILSRAAAKPLFKKMALQVR